MSINIERAGTVLIDGLSVGSIADAKANYPNLAAGIDLAVSAWDESSSAPIVEVATDPTQDDYARALQSHIDAVARSHQYGSGVLLASYIASTIPAWAAEAQAFVAWRDTVWMAAYQVLAGVQSGSNPPPSMQDFIAALPVIQWPS